MKSDRFLKTLAARGIALSDAELDRVLTGKVEKLFTQPTQQVKLAKSLKKDRVATLGLMLMPSNGSGFNLCSHASDQCKLACITWTGHGQDRFLDADGMNDVHRARRRKAHWWILRREEFLAQEVKELEAFERKCKQENLEAACRLNVLSDILHERHAVTRNGKEYPNVMSAFPGIAFYDYTKVPGRHDLPPNYSLTFSRSESNEADVTSELAAGRNVAVVFTSEEIRRKIGTRYLATAPLPATWRGIPVIDGDVSDARHKDPQGVIVGLRAKGRLKTDTSGFAVDFEEQAA